MDPSFRWDDDRGGSALHDREASCASSTPRVESTYRNPIEQYIVNMQYRALDVTLDSGFERSVHFCNGCNTNYIDGDIR